MAITQLIAVGTDALNSADIEVTKDTPTTVCLKDAGGTEVADGCHVEVQIKDDAGQYFRVGDLNGSAAGRALTITGPGTYRLSRPAGGPPCGAFSA